MAGAEATSRSKAESLAVPLSQGLQSKDKDLLERCIGTSNPRVIDATVANLSAGDAGLLLETAVERLDYKLGQRQVLVMWIRAVLLRHTAYLMSSGSQQQTLTKLHNIIEEQTQMIQPLKMLSGRLELLLAQTDPPGKQGQDTGTQESEVEDMETEEGEDESEEESEDSEEEA